MKTAEELRAFMFGVMTGITLFVGALAFVSWDAGIKWQPVKVSQNP